MRMRFYSIFYIRILFNVKVFSFITNLLTTNVIVENFNIIDQFSSTFLYLL